MSQYIGELAQRYHQTNSKYFLLIPAIYRCLPSVSSSEARVLDIGCGNGDFFTLVTEKGYQYYGLDLSPDMIERAKKDYPHGNYLISSATSFAARYMLQFDVVLINMLFPAFRSKAEITQTLKESLKVLKEDGVVIIGVTHPCFDHYMRVGVLDYKERVIETDFQGYFKSGTQYLIHEQYNLGEAVLADYHWTLSDYISCIREADLSLINVDECEPDTSGAIKDESLIRKKSLFPTFLVFVCKH